MAEKEATARIKINRLLEEAGWRLFAKGDQPANIGLEPTVEIREQALSRGLSITKHLPRQDAKKLACSRVFLAFLAPLREGMLFLHSHKFC